MSGKQVPASSGSSDQNKMAMSSGSEDGSQYALVDDRKKRRMISNRESARRSRQRKQNHLDELLTQVTQLQKDNDKILLQVNATSQVYVNVESENSILRAQMTELSDRLQSLNSVLHVIEEVSGVNMDIPEIPDPLLKPWHHPIPFQPIPASSNVFNY